MRIDQYKFERIMAKRCISVSDLCRTSSVSMTTIQRMRSGFEVKPKTAGLIAKALSVDVSCLLCDEIMEASP